MGEYLRMYQSQLFPISLFTSLRGPVGGSRGAEVGWITGSLAEEEQASA